MHNPRCIHQGLNKRSANFSISSATVRRKADRRFARRQGAAEDNRAGMFLGDVADDRRAEGGGMILHDFEHFFGGFGGTNATSRPSLAT